MARSIFELVFRAVDQGASATVAGLQSALGAMPGAAQQAGAAVGTAVSQTGAAAQSAAHAAQSAASSALSSVQHVATGAATAVQSTANAAGQAAESMGAKFAKLAATIGALGFLKAAVAEFSGFDDAMLRVQALSKATAADFDALKAKAAELGASTKFTAAEAAEGMSQLAAAGYNTSQILDSIGPAMHAAAAGGSDLGETADQLTNIMGAFQLQADQSGKVADALTAGFTGSATTLSQLANAMVYCGPVAKTLGYTLQDTTGILMALADVGIKGEQAGTALRGGFARLIRPMRVGQKVLDKYKIQLRDAEGKMRDFADILHDVGQAGLTEGEKLKLFGVEAGPAMMALMDKGRDAIKKYQEQVEKSAGRAKEVSDHTESGLGGALRRLDAAWTAVKNSFGEAIAPAIRQIADALSGLAAWFAKMPDWAKQTLALAAVLATIAGSFSAIAAVAKLAAGGFMSFVGAVGSVFAPMSALTANMVTYTQAVALLGGKIAALKMALRMLGSVVASAFAGWFIGEWLNQFEVVRQAGVALAAGLEKAFLRAKLAWAWWMGTDAEVAAIERELERVDKIYGEMFAEIGTKADQYKKRATTAHKDVAKSAQENSKKIREITEEDLEAMRKLWQDYVKQVRELQDQIAGRERSLAAELREMGRSGMSDLGAWQDRKREAEEYVEAAKKAAAEARAAFAEGDTITGEAKFKEAVQLADDAKAAYRELNKEVKDGDQVLIAKADALKAAMSGVEEAGRLGVDILKQQKQATIDAMTSIEKDVTVRGVNVDELKDGLNEAEEIWLEKWQNMRKAAEDAGQQVYNVWQNAAGFWTNVNDAFSAGWSKSAETFRREMDGVYADFSNKGKSFLDEMRENADAAANGISKSLGDAGERIGEIWKNAAGFWTNVNDAFSAGWSEGATSFRREWEGAYADFDGKARSSAENFAQNWRISTENARGLTIQLADDIKRSLDEATRPREVVIYTREVAKRALGGMVGAFRRGGRLPGYGGGDRISALLEAGEYVIRKEAVARFGAGFFDALNSLRLPDFSALMPAPALAAAAPAGPSRTVNINLTLPSGDTYQLSADPATADRIEREQARWWSLRSSNRVKHPVFGRTR